MNKLQLRVDRDDAELIARALRYLGYRWNDATQPHRALELATAIDARVVAYFGHEGAIYADTDKPGTVPWVALMSSYPDRVRR